MKSCALVLLPGLDGTGRLFEPLIRVLPDWIEPLVVSYPVDRVFGYAELDNLVSQALPRDRDYVVLGESFSGPLAVMAAGRRPAGLKGIVLCASFVRNPFRLVPRWAGHLSVAPIYRLWPATIRLRALLADRRYASVAESALDAIGSVRPEVVAARVRAILSVDVTRDLLAIAVPILYLAGRKDRLIRRHNVSCIKRLRPDMRVAGIDTRHLVLQMEPQESAREIARFMTAACRGKPVAESAVGSAS